ncbi:hypothetical protein PIROE2DRAFT_2260 [Piromyces sp. E2]|nr:hypothetical protein PIROE2DRAFT_2260 [Piromyces sp. E2]|eukprot:OUM69828.1 hypothetical protein PIROE2DRAFT_2260 [Piromyces sp. E2]
MLNFNLLCFPICHQNYELLANHINHIHKSSRTNNRRTRENEQVVLQNTHKISFNYFENFNQITT